MASIYQDIQTVRSLRKDIRDPKLSPLAVKAIETIHQCIASSSEHQGWKKVEWRGNNHSSSRPSQHYQGSYSKNQAYSNRPNQRSADSSSHSFHNRTRNALIVNQKDSIQLASQVMHASQVTHATQVTHASQLRDTQEPSDHHRRVQENADGFRTPNQKYISKFKKTTDKVEDTILNTILLGKLNKFSEPNYNEIKEFITHIIDSGQTDMIKCFMNIVFEKAASEEIFCPLYARLLSELSTQYPVLLSEMSNLFSKYMKIFEEIVDDDSDNYDELCKRNVEKKYRRGYSQFLAELIKYNTIDTDTFIKTLLTIITQIEINASNTESIKLNEEFADCLMKVMKAIRINVADMDDDHHIYQIRNILKQDIMKRIQPLSVKRSDCIGLSNKARFTFLDIYESIQQF
jgi:hypothetical protein